MTELLVQTYLRSGKTFEQLEAEHGVCAYPCDDKIALNYDINAKDSDPLARQCRGLVLRADTFDIVSYPFSRFFNHGQGCAATIDWDTAVVEEKLDGTMCNVYHDGNHWHVGTRKRAEANLETLNGEYTCEALANKAAKIAGKTDLQGLMAEGDRNKTYVFELTSPFNQIVVSYDDIKLTLLAVRDLTTLLEENPRLWADKLCIDVPRLYNVHSFSDMVDFVNSMNKAGRIDHEGCVVKDAAFNRVKVKDPRYCFANSAHDTVGKSWKRVAEAVITGIADDLLPIVPEYMVERLTKMQEGISKAVAETLADYAEINHVDNMKEYAEYAKNKRWPDALFALKRGKAAHLDDYLKKMPTDRVVEIVKKFNPGLLEGE